MAHIQKKLWWEPFAELNLYDGHLKTISENEEDMLEISYPDGMLIDVGWYSYKSCYTIIVVSSNTTDGWRNPLAKIDVKHADSLPYELQSVITAFRI